jgi:hypothetical protein
MERNVRKSWKAQKLAVAHDECLCQRVIALDAKNDLIASPEVAVTQTLPHRCGRPEIRFTCFDTDGADRSESLAFYQIAREIAPGRASTDSRCRRLRCGTRCDECHAGQEKCSSQRESEIQTLVPHSFRRSVK